MFDKTKFSFTSCVCDVPVDVNAKISFSVFCSFNIIIFSGSKRPCLMNKFCFLRFSISFPMVTFLFKFDALTAMKIICCWVFFKVD